MNDGRWDRWGVVSSYQGLGGGTEGGYYLLVCFLCLFLLVLLSFGLSCPASFLSEWSMIAAVSVSLFIICFLCLRSL